MGRNHRGRSIEGLLKKAADKRKLPGSVVKFASRLRLAMRRA